jgi:hypothetical protein
MTPMRQELNGWDAESVQDSDLLDLQLAGDWSENTKREVLEAVQGARISFPAATDLNERIAGWASNTKDAEKQLQEARGRLQFANDKAAEILNCLQAFDYDEKVSEIYDMVIALRGRIEDADNGVYNAMMELPDIEVPYDAQ